MYERMGFIIAKPSVDFNYRSIRTIGMVDCRLFADTATYEMWWDCPLPNEFAAMLLGGMVPHQPEDGDDTSWVDGWELQCRRINHAIDKGDLDLDSTLGDYVGWAQSVGREIAPELQRVAAVHARVNSVKRKSCRRQRQATLNVKQVILDTVFSIEERAKACGEPFDRSQMPGSPDELSNHINASLEKVKQKTKSNATLRDHYYGELGLRWPQYTRRGGLTALMARLATTF